MQFDLKKPYGVVYGHPVARYEQNGIHYDGAMQRISQEKMDEVEEIATIAREVEEKKKLEELAKTTPSLVRRGRPPGSKNKPKEAGA